MGRPECAGLCQTKPCAGSGAHVDGAHSSRARPAQQCKHDKSSARVVSPDFRLFGSVCRRPEGAHVLRSASHSAPVPRPGEVVGYRAAVYPRPIGRGSGRQY
ncbi:unnamed protein product [Amoebophrya sp. A120]|nr:unnamed protein product [Amoebophrya sp. A120]|eukprot:GSA120T00003154001.1